MIILKIPRRIDNKNLRDFILLQVKKFRKNQKHRYIQLQGDIAYSQDYVYFVFPNRALELAFALSLFFKCQKHNIPCTIEFSKPIDLNMLPREVVEAARIWCERKLPRKYYKLRNASI